LDALEATFIHPRGTERGSAADKQWDDRCVAGSARRGYIRFGSGNGKMVGSVWAAIRNWSVRDGFAEQFREPSTKDWKRPFHTLNNSP